MAIGPFDPEVEDIAVVRAQQKRAKLRITATIWLALNAFLCMIWAVTGADFPWFLFPLGATAIPLAIHGAVANAPVNREAIARELERRERKELAALDDDD